MNGSMHYLPSFDSNAIEQVIASWRERYPEMGVLALLPEAESSVVSRLQDCFRQRDIPLCGGIFPQLIFDKQFRANGICLLRFDRMPQTALLPVAAHDSNGANATAEAISEAIAPFLDDDIPATLLMLLDAMLPNIATLLDELYLRLANRVQYAGVNAGSERFQPMRCLFDAEHLVDNAVLILLLKPHQGAILEHGYQIQQHSLPVTSAAGNRIIQIDWRPAFEVYQELVRNQFGVAINRDNFYQYAVHFPFGILRANHNVLVRIPVLLDDDNALFCIGEVPPHSMLTLLEAPAVDSTSTLETLRLGLSQLQPDQADNELLLFYCAGRRVHLGDAAASEELQGFKGMSGANAVAGALALGEIGGSTLWGYPLFHNATLITCRWVNR